MDVYPRWFFYPADQRPPGWCSDFVDVVANARHNIESSSVSSLTSDIVLEHIRPDLEGLGYEVESGKKANQRIRRPVLFGDQGIERVSYEVDAVHDDLGVVVEIEAGRGARGNAVFRDLVRASLIVGARYLVIGVMIEYRHQSGGKPISVKSYDDTKNQLDAIYASGRLGLPFEGILLLGY